MEQHLYFKDINGNTAIITVSEKGYQLVVTHFNGTSWTTPRPCKAYWQVKEILKSMGDEWKCED